MSDEQNYRATIVGILEATSASLIESDQLLTPELATAALEDAVAKYSSELLLRIPDIVQEWFADGGRRTN
jgi:hypothetical protein